MGNSETVKNKKLFVFTASFPFGSGEVFLANEISILSQTFSKIIIIPCSYPKGNMNKKSLPANVKTLPPYLSKSLPIRILRSFFNCAPGSDFIVDFFLRLVFFSGIRLNRWGNDFISCRTFLSSKHYEVLKRNLNGPDILYFYWGVGSASFIPFLKTPNRIVVRLHGGDAKYEINHNYLPLRKKIYTRVDCILTISENLKNYITVNHPIKNIEEKTVVSRLGTKDLGLNPIKLSNELTIVSCSYLIPLKRVERIAQSLMLIKNKKIVWHHFGEGYLLDYIKLICSSLPSNITAIFHGQVKNEEILNFYITHHVDLFINVSTTEGIPVSIMEAMSTGIIVVATNVGATNELVDISCGYLLEADFSNEELSLIISTVRHKNFYKKRELTRTKWSLLYDAKINYRELSYKLLR